MDISEYRKQVETQIEDARGRGAGYREFLDRSKPTPERVSAARSATALREQEEISQTCDIIRDPQEEVPLRVAALESISIQVSQSHDLIDMALGLLRDASKPEPLRQAALRVLQRSSFRAALFNPKRPEYLEVLRGLIDDGDADLREQALGILASEKDDYAQRRLLEGLQDPGRALVPPEKGIQLLGYDIHAEHLPIVRQYAQASREPLVKQEAVRLLSADPTSKGLLEEILKDKDEAPEVRSTSAMALQSLDPRGFQARARQIVLDEDEDEELRATCLNALTHFGDPEALRQDAELDARVDDLSTHSPSPQIKQMAATYQAKRLD